MICNILDCPLKAWGLIQSADIYTSLSFVTFGSKAPGSLTRSYHLFFYLFISICMQMSDLSFPLSPNIWVLYQWISLIWGQFQLIFNCFFRCNYILPFHSWLIVRLCSIFTSFALSHISYGNPLRLICSLEMVGKNWIFLKKKIISNIQSPFRQFFTPKLPLLSSFCPA